MESIRELSVFSARFFFPVALTLFLKAKLEITTTADDYYQNNQHWVEHSQSLFIFVAPILPHKLKKSCPY